MLGLVPNSLVKWTHPDESFELVWLKKEFFDGKGNHLHWRIRTQASHVFDVPESQLSPLFPCVEEKEDDTAYRHLREQNELLKSQNASMLESNMDGEMDKKEILSLREQINQTNIEVATLRKDNAELKKENEHLKNRRPLIAIPCDCTDESPYIQKDGKFIEYVPKENGNTLNPSGDITSSSMVAESAPAIDWTKDVYCRNASHEDHPSCYRVSPDGKVMARLIGDPEDAWDDVNVLTKSMIQSALKIQAFIVIPNPWPEEEKPEVFIEEEDAKEISARGETVMPPGVSGSNVIEERYRGVYVDQMKTNWWRISENGKRVEHSWEFGKWEDRAEKTNYFRASVDRGEITLDPNPPWMKKEEKTWKVGDECEAFWEGKWLAGKVIEDQPYGTYLVDFNTHHMRSGRWYVPLVDIRPLGRSKKEIAQEAIELLRKAAFEKHIDAGIADKLATEYEDAREE